MAANDGPGTGATEGGAPGGSPVERQGLLLQDLARALLVSADLTEEWRRVTAAFIPDADGWVGRILVTDADGSARGGDNRFAADSQFSLLIEALQHACAEQREAFVSLRLDAERRPENLDAVAISSDLNYDTDPGDFEGRGGLTAAIARAWVERLGAERLPQWVRERAEQG